MDFSNMFKSNLITYADNGVYTDVMASNDYKRWEKNRMIASKVMRDYATAKEQRMIRDKFKIKKVIFNKPATIVFWEDGTKTVVKASGENFDKEKGLAMAITKKILGLNKGNYNNIFKKWCKEENND